MDDKNVKRFHSIVFLVDLIPFISPRSNLCVCRYV